MPPGGAHMQRQRGTGDIGAVSLLSEKREGRYVKTITIKQQI